MAPGITIKDRLRVLQPNDPDSYYRGRELVPTDMLADIGTGQDRHHQLPRVQTARDGWRSRKAAARCSRAADAPLDTIETEGQMLQRVMPDLMGFKNIVVLNDEAHHCYREKPDERTTRRLNGDEQEEAKKNNEAARLWIAGLEAVKPQARDHRASIDLSATPFFLRGSGYRRGHAVPLDDQRLLADGRHRVRHRQAAARARSPTTSPATRCPMFRNLWENIRKKMPKKGRGKAARARPAEPADAAADGARSALRPLREDVRALGAKPASTCRRASSSSATTPSTSKLVYDYISGFHAEERRWHDARWTNGRLALFRNFDETRQPPAAAEHAADRQRAARIRRGARRQLPRRWPPTRSSGSAAKSIERTGDAHAADNITDQELLREVMNTVGKPGRLGEPIRCVVSVSMLTEGWDANTVTHVLGVRAFGTQLLCEQVIGRGAAPPVLRPERRGAVQRRIRRHPRHPVRLHRQAGRSRRRSRRARRSRSRPCDRSAMRWKSASRASRATASSCPRSG